MNVTDEIRHSLRLLDLGEHEIEVYLALLKVGSTGAGALVKETKLHRQFVYSALSRLIEKGLVKENIFRNRKRFEVLDPSRLVGLQLKRVRTAENILGSLQSLWSGKREGVEVELRYGKEEFFLNLERIAASAARCDGIMRIVGGASDRDFYALLGRRYKDYLKILSRYNVKKYLIAPENNAVIFRRKFKKERGNQLRTLVEGLSSPTYTRITKELISIEIYSDEPTILRVQNSAVAKSYLDHFHLLWKRAKVG